MIRRILSSLALATVLSLPTQAEAQRFGPQVVWGDDSDLGLGVRAEWDVGSWFTGDAQMPVQLTRTRIATSFDWFFPGCDDDEFSGECSVDYWEINGNVLVPVTVGTVDPYVGVGLNIAHASVELDAIDFSSSDTEVGLNLLGGLNFLMGNVSSYVEGRFEIDGGEQFVLTWGVLLGSVE